MSIGDFFKGLLLDTWYKAFVYIGGIALLLSFFIDAKGISNINLQLITSGVFLIGIGEWKNHKQDSWIKPPNAYTGPAAVITQTSWQPDIIGICFDLVGIVLLIIGIVGASKSPLSVKEIPTPTPIASPFPISTPTFTPNPSISPAITSIYPVTPIETLA